jgi:murein DD-endopeptidase MepM/ murein hydrolase activator NlpD
LFGASIFSTLAVSFSRTNLYAEAVIIRILFAVGALLASVSSQAQQLESYPFSIESEKEGDGHRIVARNNGPAPVSIKVSIADSQYIAPDRPFPVFAVVPPGGGTLYLARIRPAIAGVGYTFRLQSNWLLGDFNATQSPDAVFRLPFQEGMTFVIGQAPGGTITTHTTPESQYAVDIGMPQGTPIVAARDGVVIYTEANQVYGGQSPDMMTKANEVRIQHIDGTIAEYAHFAHGGVFVYPGQRVTAGTQIGLAGSTGYSSGSHLHFAVLTVARSGNDLASVSLPFRFYAGNNPPTVFSPLSGMIAKAEYSFLIQAPSSNAPTQEAVPPSSAQTAIGNPGTIISFEVPTSVSTFFKGIPVWIWLVGIAAIVLLFMILDKLEASRKRQAYLLMREPTIQSSPTETPVDRRR